MEAVIVWIYAHKMLWYILFIYLWTDDGVEGVPISFGEYSEQTNRWWWTTANELCKGDVFVTMLPVVISRHASTWLIKTPTFIFIWCGKAWQVVSDMQRYWPITSGGIQIQSMDSPPHPHRCLRTKVRRKTRRMTIKNYILVCNRSWDAINIYIYIYMCVCVIDMFDPVRADIRFNIRPSARMMEYVSGNSTDQRIVHNNDDAWQLHILDFRCKIFDY